MNFAKVMDELAAQLDGQLPDGSTNVYAYPPKTLTPPAIVVGFPIEPSAFDQTYVRGSDKIVIPVMVFVPDPYQPTTKALLGPYCDSVGDYSVKAILERPNAPYAAFGRESLVVRFPVFDVASVGGIDYMAAVFAVELTGKGA